MNPLRQLAEFGQAVWLDDIHRELMTSGQLKRLIRDDGLCGITSNPAIFQKAITDSDDYDEDIRALRDEGKDLKQTYEALALKDVQRAADEFASLHSHTDRTHGYVSLEVDPHLARDPRGTIDEATRLWRAVDRSNVFIKVPATKEGLPAITELINRGININVTLLFGLERYREVARAYLAGLEQRLDQRKAIDQIRSVASFFLSRIDVLLDPRLDELAGSPTGSRAKLAGELRGQVAIASAKLAHQIYREIQTSERWQRLAAKQANPQWLLWASTSTKNPDYSDVKYVEPLIGPETVNTLPMKTLEAYRDHGKPEQTLEQDIENARRVMVGLKDVGIEIDDVTQELVEEGIEKFCKPLDQLYEALQGELARSS